MTDSSVRSTRLDNGLTVLVESLPEVQSTAFSLWVPAGSAYDPPGASGIASVLCDWMTRGAGDRDNRAFLMAVDRLGVQHQEQVSASQMSFGGVCLPEKLSAALQLTGDMVRAPQLVDDEFAPSVASVLHELQGIEDEPRQKVMLELIRRFYPTPWNQPSEGDKDHVESLTPDQVRAHFSRTVHPYGAILGIAGRVSFDDGVAAAKAAFGTWKSEPVAALVSGPRGEKIAHMAAESQQTQIGLAFPAVAYRDPDYYAAWAAVSVLSGGMSSRLFTEVREKRGLVYSVYATLSTLKDTGAIFCYAGTTNERAQETLDVMLAELARLRDGITIEELRRSQALAKSSLVMQQESSSARAGAIARDWYHLGRVASLEEIQQKIAALTPEQVVDYVRRYPLTDPTIVTIGPKELRVDS
jgi:predicted Zn-dependent peptidase